MSRINYRNLPSIQEIDEFLEGRGKPCGRRIRNRVQQVLEELRSSINNGSIGQFMPSPTSKQKILEWMADRVGEERKVIRVINATGVVMHTNLGRAPLSRSMLESLLQRFTSYSSLEFDLEAGKRGSRDARICELLKNLSGAEMAMLVNNNASAVFLMLKVLAEDREVLVSRGELVEIGGSFRVPDIIRESGAVLIEVGTTNRTRLADYQRAITERTVAILKVHPSNYVIQGFTETVEASKLSELAKVHELYCLHDWGSGSFYQFKQPGLSDYATAQQEIQSGVDVLCFSADKLLGGVQGGIVLGRTQLIERMRCHPLYRALRVDKLTLGLLEEVLEAYFDPVHVEGEIPTIWLLEREFKEIRNQAERVLNKLRVAEYPGWEVFLEKTESRAGGGALPELTLPSCALVIRHSKFSALEIQDWLRQQPLPLIARVASNQVWLDFRTVFQEEETSILETIGLLFQSGLVEAA